MSACNNKAIIIDIDDTIYDTKTQTFNEHIRDIVLTYADSGVHVVFLTHRHLDSYDETDMLLKRIGIKRCDYSLVMRLSMDSDDSAKYKRLRLKILREVYTILFAIDDNQSVVDMYIEEGIPVLKCFS